MTSPSGSGGGLHGVMAAFDAPERLVEAARAARAAGYRRLDAFSPVPVHGLAEVLELKDRKVQAAMLAGGITGALTGFGMQTFATVFHNPFNIGGRPLFSWPAYIIITFELTVLFAGLTGLVALLVANGLPRLHHPVFAAPDFERASHDRFFLLLEGSDPGFRAEEARAFLQGLNPLEVSDVEA